MNAEKLTNMQLFHLAQNKNINSEIRNMVCKEMNARFFSEDESKDINNINRKKYVAGSESLSLIYKLIALTIPVFPVIHVILTSRYLAYGKTKKWNQYWIYFCLGQIMWAAIAILIGKNFL